MTQHAEPGALDSAVHAARMRSQHALLKAEHVKERGRVAIDR